MDRRRISVLRLASVPSVALPLWWRRSRHSKIGTPLLVPSHCLQSHYRPGHHEQGLLHERAEREPRRHARPVGTLPGGELLERLRCAWERLASRRAGSLLVL